MKFCLYVPPVAGHFNPFLPVARGLVQAGHEVHWLGAMNFKEAIEGTGATYYGDEHVLSELFDGVPEGGFRHFAAMGKRKPSLPNQGKFGLALFVCDLHIMEDTLPGLLRWFAEVKPHAVMYCPWLSKPMPCAAQLFGIPSVGLLTTAGPGASGDIYLGVMRRDEPDFDAAAIPDALRRCESLHSMVESLNRTYEGLGLDSNFSGVSPLGSMDCFRRSATTLVTTTQNLRDPEPAELEAWLSRNQVRFDYVGGLIDSEGAARATGYGGDANSCGAAGASDIVAQVKAARAAGRRVLLVSFGTLITNHAWTEDARRLGWIGKDICIPIWEGIFQAFRSESSNEGPLIVVATGPKQDIAELHAPPNALCAPTIPQVDILRAGVDLFLTHCGMNSWSEGLAAGVPMVFCPVGLDTVANAAKGVAAEVGVTVERADPAVVGKESAMQSLRTDVVTCVQAVLAEPRYREAAQRCAKIYKSAGGVSRCVELVVAAAERRPLPGPREVELDQ